MAIRSIRFSKTVRNGRVNTLNLPAAVSNLNIIPTGTVSFTSVPTSINEGFIANISISTSDAVDSRILYWTVNNISTTNADFIATNGTANVIFGNGTFAITPSIYYSEGTETFRIDIRSNSITGNILVTSNIISINDTNTINPPIPVIEYLVVAGGGGAPGTNPGGAGGGGGGAGGLLAVSNVLLSSGTYTVTVGGGGAAGVGLITASNGFNSSFHTFTANGGGAGARYNPSQSPDVHPGFRGGSGGGGTYNSGTGGLGIPGQGNPGGNSGALVAAGGGGGAGAPGIPGGPGAGQGGRGGHGAISFISGANLYYAGGGGAATDTAFGPGITPAIAAGGAGGGGTGGNATAAAGSGGINTGGGGGGRSQYAPPIPTPNSTSGGGGGSGIVILRHPDAFAVATTEGSPNVIYSNANIIYRFWQSGTITF